MTEARLDITDARGRRTVALDKPTFTIGRRSAADLQVTSRDVSRDHAEIARRGDEWVLCDRGSRCGTFLNGERITAHPLVHGDRIGVGQTGETELVFVSEEQPPSGLREAASGVGDLQHVAALLNSLRAIGSGRVLDEVLMLVLDSALDVSPAERGFIMLATPGGDLELRVARGRGHVTLPGASFATSHKVPRDAFDSGETRILGDLLEDSAGTTHLGTVAAGIRQVLCVPLRVAPHQSSTGEMRSRVIGVLYLDGPERLPLRSETMRSMLEAFATQAALAIESARLYAEAAEKARLERDLRVAADIQRALLPEPGYHGATFDVAAASMPCRTVGGDFFDYLELSDDRFGFALGDVAGKGPPAALLATAVQSNLVAQAPVAPDPAAMLASVNRALLRRAIEARFATLFYGTLWPDGRLRYCNGGQEPPLLVRAEGAAMEGLDAGGPVLGLLSGATYDCGATQLAPGDLVVVFSDGITEARNEAGEEFGRARVCAALAGTRGRTAEAALDGLLAAVRDFAGTEAQSDDITTLVLRYRGPAV